MTVSDTLKQRNSVHGDFDKNAEVFCDILNAIGTKGWKLNKVQKNALYMIIAKISRIVGGDPNHADHWHDIAGYATLAERQILERNAPSSVGAGCASVGDKPHVKDGMWRGDVAKPGMVIAEKGHWNKLSPHHWIWEPE